MIYGGMEPNTFKAHFVRWDIEESSLVTAKSSNWVCVVRLLFLNHPYIVEEPQKQITIAKHLHQRKYFQASASDPIETSIGGPRNY